MRESKGKNNGGKRKGGWWTEQQQWAELFRGYCGLCWKWGHKKAQCDQWRGRRPMELGAMESYPPSVVSDPGCSVSQRVQAVNSTPVQPACWSTAADVGEDWPEEL